MEFFKIGRRRLQNFSSLAINDVEGLSLSPPNSLLEENFCLILLAELTLLTDIDVFHSFSIYLFIYLFIFLNAILDWHLLKEHSWLSRELIALILHNMIKTTAVTQRQKEKIYGKDSKSDPNCLLVEQQMPNSLTYC